MKVYAVTMRNRLIGDSHGLPVVYKKRPSAVNHKRRLKRLFKHVPFQFDVQTLYLR